MRVVNLIIRDIALGSVADRGVLGCSRRSSFASWFEGSLHFDEASLLGAVALVFPPAILYLV
jgi:hypothetical protein